LLLLLLRDGIVVGDDAGVLAMARIRRLDTSVGQPGPRRGCPP
jgi:hypothetical protein